MGKAFEMIMEGLEAAAAYQNGNTVGARVHRPVDVRAIRARTGKTREAFAATYGLPLGTVRDWEQQKRRPDAPARALLKLIDADPERVARILGAG